MSAVYEAHLHPDGSCDVYDTIEERRSGAWPSVRAWADTWLEEWRASQSGPAGHFISALTDAASPGVVEVLVVLAEAAGGDEEMLGWVGAGPIEDLVSHSGNGAGVLAEVDRAARQEPAFRAALSGAWLNAAVPDDVRDRLAQFGARDFVAEQAMTEHEFAAYVVDREAKGWH